MEARKCLFDPRKPGPMKVISETGSISYLPNRAIEEIVHAQEESNHNVCNERLRKAVALLLLALVKRGEIVESEKE